MITRYSGAQGIEWPVLRGFTVVRIIAKLCDIRDNCC